MQKPPIPARLAGAKAEDAVAALYDQNSYRILARNYARRGGEIDLIAMKHHVVHFVEVKARQSLSYGAPREAVDYHKRQRLRHVAQDYLCHHPGIDRETTCFVFDIAEVYLASRCIHVLFNAFGMEEA